MINSIKKICIYLRNVTLWLTPFLIFSLVLFLITFFLKADLSKYIELLKILIWPVTVLIGLFFFRKVVTYMFFSMDEFNFFGVKGELKNVNQMINEEVEKRLMKEKEEQSTKEEMKKLEEKFSNTSNSAEENLQLARDFYKVYQDYKEETERKIQNLIIENNNLRENVSQIQKSENVTPIITDQLTNNLGTGEKIEDSIGVQPQS